MSKYDVFDSLDPHRVGKCLGAVGGEEHVPGLLHDQPRQPDRVLDRRDPGHRPAAAIDAVHDRGVELVAALPVEDRASAGVEQRIVLHHDDHLFDGVDGVAAVSQHTTARLERRAQGDSVVLSDLGVVSPGDRPRPAVDHQCPARQREIATATATHKHMTPGESKKHNDEPMIRITPPPTRRRISTVICSVLPYEWFLVGVSMATPGHMSRTFDAASRQTRALCKRTLDVRSWLFVLAVVSLVIPAAALEGPPRFDRLSLEEGLSQSIVEAIVQDDVGFMWFATENGLNRYDGYEFTLFTNQANNSNSLSSIELKAVYLDDSGRLVGRGIRRRPQPTRPREQSRSPGTCTTLRTPTSLSGQTVRCVVEDPDGFLWVGTQGDGLNRLDPAIGSFRTLPPRPQHGSTA